MGDEDSSIHESDAAMPMEFVGLFFRNRDFTRSVGSERVCHLNLDRGGLSLLFIAKHARRDFG